MGELETLRAALSNIAEISRAAISSNERTHDGNEARGVAICTPKALPRELQVRAAQTAVEVNPVNAPAFSFLPFDDDTIARVVSDPQAIAVLTAKYWGPSRRRLSVSFMESTPSDLRTRILEHLNAWKCGIEFVQTSGTGQVRISRGQGGYWSYLGTDILHISTSRQTMNLEGFSMSTSEREFRRVIRHEAGHTLGFPHEHMRRELVARIDPEKAYEYFQRTQGWNREMVNQQVLTPLDDRSIMATRPDDTSIMCYQLPGEITRDGTPIIGGADINVTDGTFARRIYPPAAVPRKGHKGTYEDQEDQEAIEEGFVREPVLVD